MWRSLITRKGKVCFYKVRVLDWKCETILVGKPEGKRPFGRPRRRCEDDIKMNLRELWLEGVTGSI
jgi:hypothetical protein